MPLNQPNKEVGSITDGEQPAGHAALPYTGTTRHEGSGAGRRAGGAQSPGEIVPSGRYFPSGGAGAAERCAAEALPRLAGWLVVLAHRDPVAAAVTVGGRPVGFGEFARWVASANPARLPVVLMVCGAGLSASDGGLAAVVRAATGSSVLATPGVVWQTASGVRTAPWARTAHGPAEEPGWWHHPADGGTARWVDTDLGGAVRVVTPGVRVRGLSRLPLARPVAWIGSVTSDPYLMTAEQFAGLTGRGLRIDDKDPPNGDGFFTALIRQAPRQVRALGGLNSDNPLALMPAAALRKKMAEQFGDRYDARPDRYDAVLVDARGQRVAVDQVVALLGSPEKTGGVLRAVLPLLAADMLGVWVTTVTADGSVHPVGPADNPVTPPPSSTEVQVMSLAHFAGHFLPLVDGEQRRPPRFAPDFNSRRTPTPADTPAPRQPDVRAAQPAHAPTPQPASAPPGQVVWLSSPRDGLRAVRARDEVPTAPDWTMVVGHGAPDRVGDGDGWLDGQALANRLKPIQQGRILLVCKAAAPGTAHPDRPGSDMSLALGAYAYSDLSQPLLAPTGDAIIDEAGDVISGTWGIGDDQSARPVPNGDWLLWRNGSMRPMGTPSLRAALAALGTTLRPGTRAPERPIGLAYGTTPQQRITLETSNRIVGRMELAGRADAFYESLIEVAAVPLGARFGYQPTAEELRGLVVAAVRKDFALGHGSRYSRFVPPHLTEQQALDNLADPQLAAGGLLQLLPHVAADEFHLDLGILGVNGVAEPVGDTALPRIADGYGSPFLLVRLVDTARKRQSLLPAVPRALPPQQPVLLQPAPPAVQQWQVPAGVVPIAAASPVNAAAWVGALAHINPLAADPGALDRHRDQVRDALRATLGNWLDDMDRLIALDRFGRRIRETAVRSAGRTAWLTDQFLHAVELTTDLTGLAPGDVLGARAARAAARQARQNDASNAARVVTAVEFRGEMVAAMTAQAPTALGPALAAEHTAAWIARDQAIATARTAAHSPDAAERAGQVAFDAHVTAWLVASDDMVNRLAEASLQEFTANSAAAGRVQFEQPGPVIAPAPWTAALSATERAVVDQAGVSSGMTDLPPEVADLAYANGVMARLEHLTGVFDEVVRSAAEQRYLADLTPMITSPTALPHRLLDELDGLERFAAAIDVGFPALDAEIGPMVDEFLAAVESTTNVNGLADPAARAARAAARAAWTDTAESAAVLVVLRNNAANLLAARNLVSAAPPPGGIRQQLTAARQTAAVAAQQAQAAGGNGQQAFAQSMTDWLTDQAVASTMEDLARSAVYAHYASDDAIGQRLAQAEDRAEAAAHGVSDPVRVPTEDEARRRREWEIRERRALDVFAAQEPDRELPPGFGEEGPDHRRRYPMGQHGRMIRLGDVAVDDSEGLVARILETLPDTRHHEAVADRLRRFLADHGSHRLMNRLLGPGFVVPTVGRLQVIIRLDLGDPGHWRHVRGFVAEQTPIGEREHIAIEADHEVTTLTRRTATRGAGANASANVLTHFGAPVTKIFGATLGAGVDTTSNRSYSSGSDSVSTAKRVMEVKGETAYFDFPTAALVTGVREVGAVGDGDTHRLPFTARVGFPKEFAPLKPPDAGPSAFPATKRTLADSALLGIDPALLEGHPTDQTLAMADEVAAALDEVFSQPETVSGAAALTKKVRQALRDGFGGADAQLAEDVESFLDEESIIRLYEDVITSGAVSPALGRRQVHLIVGAQLRTAQAVSIDPVPLKEESQRFTNVADEMSHSDTLTLTLLSGKLGYTVRDPTAPATTPAIASLNASGSVTATSSTIRSTSANIGSGDIRGLVYDEDSVRYRMVMRLTATIAADIPGLSNHEKGTKRKKGIDVGTDVEMFVRIPVSQRARFEAVLAAAMQPTNAPFPVDASPLPADPVAAGQHLGAAERFPPAAMAANKGMGFTAVGRLTGGKKVMPKILELIEEAEEKLKWVREWTPLEWAYLRWLLNSRFTREALKSRGPLLFQPGGVRFEVTRPVGHLRPERTTAEYLRDVFRGPQEGTERIMITVKALRGADYRTKGRTRQAKLELMPSAFASNRGADRKTRAMGGTMQANAGGGGVTSSGGAAAAKGLLGNAAITASASSALDTSVGASGFMLQAMLYQGPAWWFDYDVTFDVTVDIEAEKVPLYRSLDGARSATANGQIPNAVARLVIPEALAPTAPVTAAEVARTGNVNIDRFLGPSNLPFNTTVSPPDVTASLTANGDRHSPLTGDDQIMEVLGTEEIGDTLRDLLEHVGVTAPAFGDLPWTITSAEHLAASMVRGPSVIMNTIVQGRFVNDRHATVKIEGFPHDLTTGTDALSLLQMSVAEGNGSLASTRSGSKKLAFGVGANWSALAGLLGGDTEPVTPSYQYTKDVVNSATAKTDTVTPTSGRLIQLNRQYLPSTATMVWRFSVVANDVNQMLVGAPRTAHALVHVDRGVSFLRLASPVFDPNTIQGPGDFPPPVPGAVPLIRTDRNPPAGRLPAPTGGEGRAHDAGHLPRCTGRPRRSAASAGRAAGSGVSGVRPGVAEDRRGRPGRRWPRRHRRRQPDPRRGPPTAAGQPGGLAAVRELDDGRSDDAQAGGGRQARQSAERGLAGDVDRPGAGTGSGPARGQAGRQHAGAGRAQGRARPQGARARVHRPPARWPGLPIPVPAQRHQ